MQAIAVHIRSFRYLDYLALQLIEALPAHNRNYDWNVGSILQHLDMETVLSALARAQSPERLYDSIGLAWVLGEFRSRNRIIVDFLRNIVYRSSDSEAWWRAAFSLEKIGVEDAVNLLKRSTKADALQPLQYYLDRLEDKRSIICILILSTSDNCVMGNLFGGDAAQFVVQNNKLEWSMALGITCNTKEEITEIIKEYA